ncbi:hypothetical protein C8J56DRAFT_1061149 [Mycena floridula]|nr:hypothetical protein C8J56DRAFT_1061149 [Mycena floridula]
MDYLQYYCVGPQPLDEFFEEFMALDTEPPLVSEKAMRAFEDLSLPDELGLVPDTFLFHLDNVVDNDREDLFKNITFSGVETGHSSFGGAFRRFDITPHNIDESLRRVISPIAFIKDDIFCELEESWVCDNAALTLRCLSKDQVTPIFNYQWRIFLFQVVIFGSRARFLQWDHSGIIVSRSFDYTINSMTIVEFFYRLNHLSLKGLGFDPQFHVALMLDAELAKNHLSSVSWDPLPRDISTFRVGDHSELLSWNHITTRDTKNIDIDDIFERVDRFVLMKEVGRPLWSFSSVEELLQVTWDTFVAHRDAYVKGNILHGDISEGNILIYRGRGLLIDWEMAKDLGNPNGKSPSS